MSDKARESLSGERRGFTLVELMIVITIIAILAAIGVVSFSRVQKQARDTKRKQDLRTIETGLVAYFTEKGIYPATATWTSDLSPTYIPTMPKDPTTKNYYTYNNDPTNALYAICAALETPSDPTMPTWKVSTKNPGGYATAEAATTCASE